MNLYQDKLVAHPKFGVCKVLYVDNQRITLAPFMTEYADKLALKRTEKLDNALRELSGGEEIARGFETLKAKFEENQIKDWNEKYYKVYDLLKEGTLESFGLLIRILRERSAYKELSFNEAGYLSRAMTMFATELACCLEDTFDNALEIIAKHLRQT